MKNVQQSPELLRGRARRRVFWLSALLIAVLFPVVEPWGGSRLAAGDPLVAFDFEGFAASDTLVSVPVRRQPDYTVEVAGLSGQGIDLAGTLDSDVSGTHAIAVLTGEMTGLRARIEWSSGSHVVIDPRIDLSGMAPGDLIEIVPGWTLENLFFEHSFPDGVRILLFERIERGIDVAASAVLEYDAGEDQWHDVVRRTPANDTVIHDTETFVLRDTRPAGESPEDFHFVLEGFVLNRVPPVDRSVKEENAPQDVRFGVPRTVTLGESGLGEHGDEILFLDAMGGAVVEVALYFEGNGWFIGVTSAQDLELKAGAVYIYRKAAPDSSGADPVSTVTLLIESENFGHRSGVPAPAGSIFWIVVDTEGEGFYPGEYGPRLPAFPDRNEEPRFLRLGDGTVTGNKLVAVGAMPTEGYIGGAYNVRLSQGDGGVEVDDPWAIIWFDETKAGETPRFWDGFGFHGANLTIPSGRQTVSFDAFIPAGMKTPDWVPLGGPLSTFQSWLVAHFYSEERQDSMRVDPAGDPGGYGVPNLIRYALNLDPRRPKVSELPQVFTGVPGGLDEVYLMIRYTRYIHVDDVEFRVQASSDFEHWQVLGSELIVETGPAERHFTETVTVRDVAPLSESGERFLRVQLRRSE